MTKPRLLCSAAAVAILSSLGAVMLTAIPAQLASLPDNPCDLLTAAQVASATGLVITSMQRRPNLMQTVAAQKAHRDPEPGTICRYETQSEFGQLIVVVPTPAERTAARYREARDHYLATFRGSARMISGVGEEAWLAGGGDLWVLTRQSEFFGVGVQFGISHNRPPDVFVAVARAVLDRLR